ncbi:MAG: DUF1080 domain-containing protein [Agriterribacter sp.]
MIKRTMYWMFLCLVWVSYSNAQSQKESTPISLNNLDAFNSPGSNWVLAGDAEADLNSEGFMKALPGTGAAVNIITKKDNTHLVTKESFGDIELELDFMMAKKSNSGVYLQGRYEVQLFDSWGTLRPGFIDCGGIYQRWDDKRPGANKGYEGIAPLVNVAKAPGLWQHFKIKFRAPKFNANGVKIANARFEEVYLNGVLVQQQAEVTGPTRSAMFEDEKAMGPLMLQGDHGNVAFRNITYRSLDSDNSTPAKVDFSTPIILNPDNRPYLLRSFLNYENKMLTHGISVGNPNQVNYSYDMKQGALFQVWRGEFANATDLWYERGEPYQRIVPMGSVIVLSDAPSVTVLADAATTAWPAPVAFDSMHNKGYTLDAARSPTFRYTLNDMNVTDKVTVPDATGLSRTITVANAPANAYIRVAVSKKLNAVTKTMYVAGDKAYYINIDEKLKAFIRQAGDNQELLVPITKNDPITYSLTW